MEPGVGFNDPCESLPTQAVYDSNATHEIMGSNLTITTGNYNFRIIVIFSYVIKNLFAHLQRSRKRCRKGNSNNPVGLLITEATRGQRYVEVKDCYHQTPAQALPGHLSPTAQAQSPCQAPPQSRFRLHGATTQGCGVCDVEGSISGLCRIYYKTLREMCRETNLLPSM